MATQVFYFLGKTKWTKVYPGQEDQKYGHFGMDFYPDDLEAFQKTGVQLQERTDDDGVFFKLRRTPTKLIKGKLADFGAPTVLDSNNQPFNQPIGNGSTVTVKLSVYDTVKGKGHRLDSVRVEDWVEYKKEGQSTEAVNVPKLPF